MKLKRILTALVLLSFLFVLPVWAFQGSQSSGEQTASKAILADAGWITGIQVITDGTNDAKLIIHNNATAASGTVVVEKSTVGASLSSSRDLAFPVFCHNGIYATISGTDASYVIEYIEK